MAPKDIMQQLVDNPVERLDVELKCWMNPAADDCKEKIAKGCLALYNNNGGYMIFGIRDDGSVDTDNVPTDVRAEFHTDIVQAIVSKFSYTPFEIKVEFRERDGQEYPIIVVPRGVITPAVSKSQLGKIHPDDVFVRSLTSNNTVSSSKPKRRDWDRLIRHCLDNREADIGGFFRRHLGVAVDIDQLRTSFSLPKSISAQAMDLLGLGSSRFDEVNSSSTVPDVGFVEIAIVIDGQTVKTHKANKTFLSRLQHHRKDYSGWPPFVYIHNPRTEEWNPRVINNAWEAIIFAPPSGMRPATIDFWTVAPTGRFYTKRALQDDMNSTGIEPLKHLDPFLHIRRIAEGIATGLSFAKAMDYDIEQSSVAFAFRWTRMSGRSLSAWANPRKMLCSAPRCSQNEIVESVLVPLNTAPAAIWQFVEAVGEGLPRAFEGYDRLNSGDFETIVNEAFGISN